MRLELSQFNRDGIARIDQRDVARLQHSAGDAQLKKKHGHADRWGVGQRHAEWSGDGSTRNAIPREMATAGKNKDEEKDGGTARDCLAHHDPHGGRLSPDNVSGATGSPMLRYFVYNELDRTTWPVLIAASQHVEYSEEASAVALRHFHSGMQIVFIWKNWPRGKPSLAARPLI